MMACMNKLQSPNVDRFRAVSNVQSSCLFTAAERLEEGQCVLMVDGSEKQYIKRVTRTSPPSNSGHYAYFKGQGVVPTGQLEWGIVQEVETDPLAAIFDAVVSQPLASVPLPPAEWFLMPDDWELHRERVMKPLTQSRRRSST